MSVFLSASPAHVGRESVETAKSKRKSIVSRIDMSHWQSSTKIEALLEELARLRSEVCVHLCIVRMRVCLIVSPQLRPPC
jgi:hypothetical protein